MAEYIEREEALIICEKEYQERVKMQDWCGDTVAWNIGHAIKTIQTADVVPVVHGRWASTVVEVYLGGGFRTGAPHCTVCNKQSCSRTPYCPNCGAKMDGGAADGI